ncbi:MAG: class I SAM-dependent methyltransferase [Mycobacteriales bacterium]
MFDEVNPAPHRFETSGAPPGAERGRVAYTQVGAADTRRASRYWWDADADAYLAEHGEFLGDVRFVWCPEGLDEADAGLLGDVAGRRVLEVGCGAAPCARWLRRRGAEVTGVDLSAGMLGHARRLNAATGVGVRLVQADAAALPFAAGSFDLACSAFGAVPFTADSAGVMREVARVLRPGGRWVFAVSHPVRWAFPDDPTAAGLTAVRSYFDRTPYAEFDDRGRPTYVEHHRTLGDRIAELVAAGFRITGLVEPEWVAGNTAVWGGWSELRSHYLPGTAIFTCDKE